MGSDCQKLEGKGKQQMEERVVNLYSSVNRSTKYENESFIKKILYKKIKRVRRANPNLQNFGLAYWSK